MAFGRGLQLFGAACMGFSLAHAQNYRFSAVLCLDRGRRGRERRSPLLWNTVVVGGQEQQEAGVAVPFDPSKVTSHTCPGSGRSGSGHPVSSLKPLLLAT